MASAPREFVHTVVKANRRARVVEHGETFGEGLVQVRTEQYAYIVFFLLSVTRLCIVVLSMRILYLLISDYH